MSMKVEFNHAHTNRMCVNYTHELTTYMRISLSMSYALKIDVYDLFRNCDKWKHVLILQRSTQPNFTAISVKFKAALNFYM